MCGPKRESPLQTGCIQKPLELEKARNDLTLAPAPFGDAYPAGTILRGIPQSTPRNRRGAGGTGSRLHPPEGLRHQNRNSTFRRVFDDSRRQNSRWRLKAASASPKARPSSNHEHRMKHSFFGQMSTCFMHQYLYFFRNFIREKSSSGLENYAALCKLTATPAASLPRFIDPTPWPSRRPGCDPARPAFGTGWSHNFSPFPR
jgi:hypothetical protein